MATKMEAMGGSISGREAAEYMEGIISGKKQVKSNWVEPTLKAVYILESPGSLDFSGKEMRAGNLKRHPTVKKEGDPYGWWTLGGGEYVIEFNEKISLPQNSFALLTPSSQLTASEASHPAMLFYPREDLCPVTLTVGPPGINLKENARISRLSVFKF